MLHSDLPVAPLACPPVVLAAVDPSSAAPLVVAEAAKLAGAMGAALHLVRVVEVLPTTTDLGGRAILVASNARQLQQAWAQLERLMASAGPTPQRHGHVVAGHPVTRILQLATDLEADVLVIGTHDPSKVEHLLFGSVASELARKAPCPVFVVRAKRHAHPDVTEILPPCPDCLAARAASRGQRMWCERHSEHHPHAHTYHESPESFAMGSQTFRP